MFKGILDDNDYLIGFCFSNDVNGAKSIDITEEQRQTFYNRIHDVDKFKYVNGELVLERDFQKYAEYLRDIRKVRCFDIINRGKFWYNKLSEEQIVELNAWYQAWLDVTNTYVIPKTPSWLI